MAVPEAEEHIVLEQTDDHLIVERQVRVDQNPFLQDHLFFGRNLSVRDPSLGGFPVMPLAMTLEMMAESALALRPDHCVAAVRDVRTQRWLAFESGARVIRIDATARNERDVYVAVFEVDRDELNTMIAEATFELDGVELDFTDDALDAVVKEANSRKTGARALRNIFEGAMTRIMFDIP